MRTALEVFVKEVGMFSGAAGEKDMCTAWLEAEEHLAILPVCHVSVYKAVASPQPISSSLEQLFQRPQNENPKPRDPRKWDMKHNVFTGKLMRWFV